MKQKQLDLICMGRIAVGLYSQQIGARLEDASSFARYLGGSSGNVAYGTCTAGAEVLKVGAHWRRTYGAFSA